MDTSLSRVKLQLQPIGILCTVRRMHRMDPLGHMNSLDCSRADGEVEYGRLNVRVGT